MSVCRVILASALVLSASVLSVPRASASTPDDLRAPGSSRPAAPPQILRPAWVDISLLIWFHPAMKEYVPSFDGFTKPPPADMTPQKLEDWQKDLYREFRAAKLKAHERLSQVRAERARAEQDLGGLVERLNQDTAAARKDPTLKEDAVAARLQEIEAAYFGRRDHLVQIVAELNIQERAALIEFTEQKLQPREASEATRARVLADVRAAIQEVARENGVAVVFPSRLGTFVTPRPPDARAWAAPGILANRYAHALVPALKVFTKGLDIEGGRNLHLEAWYRQRGRALTVRPDDGLIASPVADAQNLTVPVLARILTRAGVTDIRQKTILEFVSEVTR